MIAVQLSNLNLVQQEVVSKRYDDEEHLHADSGVPGEHHFIEKQLGVVDELIASSALLRHEDEVKDLEDDALAVHEQDDKSNQVNVTKGVIFVDHVGSQS